MRDTSITIRVSKEEKQKIIDIAKKQNFSITEYVLQKTLYPVSSSLNHSRQLASDLCALQNRAQQIESVKERNDILRGIDRIWQSIK